MAGAAIIGPYRRALAHLVPMIALYLSARLRVSALLLPLSGMFLGLVLRWLINLRGKSRMILMWLDGLLKYIHVQIRHVVKECAALSMAKQLLVWLSDRSRLDCLNMVTRPSKA